MLSAMMPPNTAEIPTITSITCKKHLTAIQQETYRKQQTKLKSQLTEYALRRRVGKIAVLMAAGLWHVPDFRKYRNRWRWREEQDQQWRGIRCANKSNQSHEGGSHTHLPAAAAVVCRAGWQDDGAGHQHLQQNHQDEVKVDLRGAWKETGVMNQETKQRKFSQITGQPLVAIRSH